MTLAFTMPGQARGEEHSATGRGVDSDREDEEDAGLRVKPALDLVKGFRAAFQTDPDDAEEEDRQPKESQATSLIASVEVEVARHWLFGVRLPVTTASFLFSNDDSEQVTSLGNTEVSAGYGMRPFSVRGLRLELELGAAIPTATGDEYGTTEDPQRHAFANLAAQRFRGYLDNALFSPHRFGVIPKVSLAWENDAWILEGFTKLELLANRGGTPPPPDLGTLNQTAAELVAGAHAEVAPFAGRLVRFGLRSWIAWTVVGEVKEPDKTQGGPAPRFQWVVVPEIVLGATPLRSSIGLIAPIGGLLGRTDYVALQLTMRLDL